jgi:hypothetical protein
MSGHQRKKQKRKKKQERVVGNSPNKKQRTSPISPQQKKPTTPGIGHCAIEKCTRPHLDHRHICCRKNCRHFVHTLCASDNHLCDKDNELRIFCSSSCKGDPVDDATSANTRANKRSKGKPTTTDTNTPATQKPKAGTQKQPHKPPFASVAKKTAPQIDSDSETNPTPEQFDSGDDQDAKPRAKKHTKHKKQKMPFTSKIFDKKRSQRLRNRHDPEIYKSKLQKFKQQRLLQQEKRKQATAFKNEFQLFCEFYNSTLKIPLRNNRREDTPQTNEERINQAVTHVNDYMQRHYSEVSSDTTQMQNEADIIQKLSMSQLPIRNLSIASLLSMKMAANKIESEQNGWNMLLGNPLSTSL